MKKALSILLVTCCCIISKAQNVGIGTSTPLYKLDVIGDVNVNSGYGYRVNGSAGTGQYLRGDGNRFTPSLILSGDLPSGSNYYIANGTVLQTADFKISGNGSAGTLTATAPNQNSIEAIGSVKLGTSTAAASAAGAGAMRYNTANGNIEYVDNTPAWRTLSFSFTASDFDDNGNGAISIDYANGQKATTGQPGFLTASDFSLFNNKIAGSSTANYVPKWTTTSGGTGTLSSTSSIYDNGNVGIGTAAPTQRLEIGGAAPVLYINGSTSNMLWFNANGVAAPALTTRSAGTKVVWYPGLSSSTVDYATGIDGSTLWNSLPSTNTAYQYKWYAGTTELMRLRADGILWMNNKNTIQATDTWLRLNQSGEYASGVYTPAALRVDGGIASGALAPGAGNIQASGWLTVNSLGNAYAGVNGVNSPYYHTSLNDSWLPYPANNYNYLRGVTYAYNNVWYDENNTNYYVDPSNTTRLNGFNVFGVSPTITFEDNDNNDYYTHINSDRFYILYGDGGWDANRPFTVYQGNKVGFGTATPGYPVEISGGIAPGANISYGYLNSGGNTGSASGNAAYSLVASNRIRCPEFNAYSDARIKHIVSRTNGMEDIKTLMQLQVTNYTHVDTIASGNGEKKGFIAQEVEQVFPQAVSRTTGWIPDIYTLSEHTVYNAQDKTLRVEMKQPHGLNEGDKVKLIRLNKEFECSVSAVANQYVFSVDNWEGKADSIFVYGKGVNDFCAVDYDKIHTLNVSATQHLYKLLLAAEQRIQQVERENNDLKCRNENITGLYNDLKGHIEALQTQMATVNERLNLKSSK